MKETNNIDISKAQRLLMIQKTGLVEAIPGTFNNDYQNKQEEVAIVKECLPAEHLTATYWG